MLLPAATPETRTPAVRPGGRVVALPGAGIDRATGAGVAAQDAGHDHAGHGPAPHVHAEDHAGTQSPDTHAHDTHVHHTQPHDAPRPAVRLGPSVLRLSLGGRLVIAGVLIAALWAVVALVTGGAA